MKSDYYSNGKRGTLDGIPIWRPKWFGELGNDAEYLEAIRPRDTFKAAYYAGGHRMVKDGIPCRLAGYVADWAPWMKRALHRNPYKDEDKDLERQMSILWPAFVPSWDRGKASCVVHREIYQASHGSAWECWTCRRAQSESQRVAA